MHLSSVYCHVHAPGLAVSRVGISGSFHPLARRLLPSKISMAYDDLHPNSVRHDVGQEKQNTRRYSFPAIHTYLCHLNKLHG